MLQLTQPIETAHRAAFVEAMSELAGGVAIVTCRVDGRPWGTTVTAFASVSADPPSVLVSLGAGSASAAAIAVEERFGVSILDESQEAIARRYSTPARPKFLEPFTDPQERSSASPLLAGALAHLDCELVERLEIADHVVFFGRVRAARTRGRGAPLVYVRHAYLTVSDSSPDRAARGA